jgi:hypothetical protein
MPTEKLYRPLKPCTKAPARNTVFVESQMEKNLRQTMRNRPSDNEPETCTHPRNRHLQIRDQETQKIQTKFQHSQLQQPHHASRDDQSAALPEPIDYILRFFLQRDRSLSTATISCACTVRNTSSHPLLRTKLCTYTCISYVIKVQNVSTEVN